MSRDVTEKVVQARFDNQSYEKNAKKTLKTNKQLEESWKFKGSRKELKQFSKELDNINTEKFNKQLDKTDNIIVRINHRLKDEIKHSFLKDWADRIKRAVNNAVKSIIGLQNAMEGWSKYETQITNIGGILNSVEKDYADHATALAAVTAEMEKLQWYTDETSFSFSTLSTGIKQFTTAGISLEKASEAAMGVTTLAGASKVFEPYKVQSAMDAVAKAMQTGYMDLMKWTSLTNTAGIVTEDFSQILLETAAAQGKLVKSQAGQYKTKNGGKLVTTENIRGTLSDKWLTGDVLTAALARYSSAVNMVKDFQENVLWTDEGPGAEVQSAMEALGITDSENITLSETIKLMDELGYEFDEVGKKALMSSYEATSFSQVMQATKDAVATQWMNIWTAIFGDADEATELWTDMSNLLYRVFVPAYSGAVDILKEWHAMSYEDGGYKSLRSALLNLVKIVDKWREAIGQAFTEVFGDFNAERIGEIVKRFENWTESLYKNEHVLAIVKGLAKSLFTIFKILGKVLGTIAKIATRVLNALSPLLTVAERFVDWITDAIVSFADFIDQGNYLTHIVDFVANAFEVLLEAIKELANFVKNSNVFKDLKNFFTSIGQKVNFDKAKSDIKGFFKTLGDYVGNGANKVKEFVTGTKEAGEEMPKAAEEIVESNEAVAESVEELTDATTEKKAKFTDSTFYQTFTSGWGALTAFFDSIGKNLVNKFNEIKSNAENGAYSIETVLDGLKSVIKKLIVVFTLFQTLKMVKGIANIAQNAADAIYYMGGMFKNIGKAFKASYIKSIGVLVVSIAATMLMMVGAIAILNKQDWKATWRSLLQVGLMMGVIFGIIVGILKLLPPEAETGKGIIRIISFISIANAIAILAGVCALMIKTVDKYTPAQLTKAGLFFLGIDVIVGAAIQAARWGNKGTPLLLSYIKTVTTILLVASIVLAFVRLVNEVNPSTLRTTIIGFDVALGLIAGLFVTVGIVAKKLSKDKLAVLTLVGAVDLLALAIAAIIAALKMPIHTNTFIADAVIMVGIALAAVLAVAWMMAKYAKNLEIATVTYNTGLFKQLAMIGLAVASLIALCVMISNLEKYVIIGWKSVGIVLSILAVVGTIAILLTKFGKLITTKSNGLKGLWNGQKQGGRQYNVGGSLLSIVLAVAAVIGTIYLVNEMMKAGTFSDAKSLTKTLVLIFGTIVVIAGMYALVMWTLSKNTTANTAHVAQAMKAMFIVMAVIIAEIMALLIYIHEAKVSWKEVGMVGALVGGMAAILGAIAILFEVFSRRNKDLKSIGKNDVHAIIAVMVAIIAGLAVIMAGVILLMQSGATFKSMMSILGPIMMMFGLMIGAVIGLILVLNNPNLKNSKENVAKMYSAMALMLAVSATVMIIATALYILKDVNTKQLWAAFGVITLTFAVITAIIVGLAYLVGMGNAAIGAAELLALGGAMLLIGVGILAIAGGLAILTNSVSGLVNSAKDLKPEHVDTLKRLFGLVIGLNISNAILAGFAVFSESYTKSITKLITTVNTLKPENVGYLAQLMELLANFQPSNTMFNYTKPFVEYAKDLDKVVKVISGMPFNAENLQNFGYFIDTLLKLKELGRGGTEGIINAEAIVQEIQKLDGLSAGITIEITPKFPDGALDALRNDVTAALAGSIQFAYQQKQGQNGVDNSVNTNNYTVNINGEETPVTSGGTFDALTGFFQKAEDKISNFFKKTF